MNTPPVEDEPAWNPHMLEPIEHVQTRGQSPTSSESPDRRHSSSASSSTLTSGSYRESSGLRGRRMKPSVTASSSQLPAVSEMKEQSEKRTNTILSGSTEVFWSCSGRSSVVSKVVPEEKIPSTKKALQVFSKVVSRNVEKEEARRKQLEKCDQEVQAQRDIYRRLVKWEARKHRGWTDYLLSWVVDHFRESPEPDVEELKSLARHYYPPRAEVKCHVCDFGEGRAEHRLVELGRIEEFFNVKPDWADVRWIHAPLGFGLIHSSVEDTFLHEGEQGRPFESAGRSGFPYLMTEILNFRHRDNFQEMRDVYLLLRDRVDLLDDLNESTWKADRNPSLHHDVQWRAGHLAQEPSYWNLVSSDMPWQLSEGLTMGDSTPMEGLQVIPREVEDQTLCMFPFFKNSHLVRDPFRTFHRGDGFLLTMSPMSGVNYLDKEFPQYLAEPVDTVFDNEDISAVGLCFKAFAEHGTSTWHRRTVEWFLIYLLTELGITPHPMRQGYNAPELNSAYSAVIQELKRRRFEKWAPNLTVQLVRKYLTCLDELTFVTLNLKLKLTLFESTLEDIKRFEVEDEKMGKPPDNPEGESAIERLEWAMATIKSDYDCFERLLVDLKQSLDALFQIRSIEQNDRQIVSEAQNKAILVFTGVTTIFLPLSFFTSYFGMNLEGIANIKETQSYFWKLCGTVAFCLVLIITLGAFSQHLRRISRARLGRRGVGMI